MAEDLSRAAFDALYEKSGLPLSAAQKDMLFQVQPMLLRMISQATAPMPREAEPALTFRPEVK
jgi:hypothetical protein